MDILTQPTFFGPAIVLIGLIQIVSLVLLFKIAGSLASAKPAARPASNSGVDDELKKVNDKLRTAEQEQKRIRRTYDDSQKDSPRDDSRKRGYRGGRDQRPQRPRGNHPRSGGGQDSRDSRDNRDSRPSRDSGGRGRPRGSFDRKDSGPRKNRDRPSSQSQDREDNRAPVAQTPVKQAPPPKAESPTANKPAAEVNRPVAEANKSVAEEFHGRKPVLKRRQLEEGAEVSQESGEGSTPESQPAVKEVPEQA